MTSGSSVGRRGEGRRAILDLPDHEARGRQHRAARCEHRLVVVDQQHPGLLGRDAAAESDPESDPG